MSERGGPRTMLRRWPLAVVAVLLLAPAAVAADRPGAAVPVEPAVQLYASADASLEPFVALDPATLADAAGVAPLDLGDAAGEWWRLSADGSTLAVGEFGALAVDVQAGLDSYQTLREAALSVSREGPGGRERVEIASVFLSGYWLSPDGSRLVVEGLPADEIEAPAPVLDRAMAWSSYDTADGRLLGRVRIGGATDWGTTVVDPAAGRLYRLVTPNAEGASGPRPVTLVAHDLLFGTGDGEIGRLDLPGVRAGWWETGRTATASDYPIMAHADPGVALSPDGRRLAVVHADAEAMTLVDTATLNVEVSTALARPVGLLERLVRLLPLVPQEAAAKFAEGTTRWATFGPDGRNLYVWGSETTMEGDEMVVHELGLRVVDAERGTILAEDASGGRILDVWPAPDGRTVYVGLYPKQPEEGAGATAITTLLRRVDARSLAVRAEREFAGDGWLGVVVRPDTDAA